MSKLSDIVAVCLVFGVLTVKSIDLQGANEYKSDDNTIFLWHFGGELKDSSPNRLDASHGEGDVRFGLESPSGLKGGASEFHGGKYLRVGPSPLLMGFSKELTFEMWMKDPLSGDGSGADIGIIGQYRQPSIQWIFCIRKDDKALEFEITVDSLSKARETICSKPLIWEKGKWYHVAAVVAFSAPDTTELKIFRSKEGDPKTTLIASKSFKGDIEKGKMSELANELQIRVGGSGNGARFLGSECFIDEVRYSHVARTEYDFNEHINDNKAQSAR